MPPLGVDFETALGALAEIPPTDAAPKGAAIKKRKGR